MKTEETIFVTFLFFSLSQERERDADRADRYTEEESFIINLKCFNFPFTGHFFELFNIQKKRCRMNFECNSQSSLQNAKTEVMLELKSLVSISFNMLFIRVQMLVSNILNTQQQKNNRKKNNPKSKT